MLQSRLSHLDLLSQKRRLSWHSDPLTLLSTCQRIIHHPPHRLDLPREVSFKAAGNKRFFTPLCGSALRHTHDTSHERERKTNLTIGSSTNNWKGLTQLQTTVIRILLSNRSIGAIHLSSPVSFLSFLALFLSSTGWYVSGTKKKIRESWTAAHIRRV